MINKQIVLQIAHRFGLIDAAPAMSDARDRLLGDTSLSDKERFLLNRLALTVSRRDGMYVPGQASHYLRVGLSAMRAIHDSIAAKAEDSEIRNILDFPSGYGRVTRFLRSEFPDSNLICGELSKHALEFCESSFAVSTVSSSENLGDISLQQKFDLIWCGSLVTHIDENAATDLIRLFQKGLRQHGVAVFTTHGVAALENLRARKATYNLASTARTRLLATYDANGFGFASYRRARSYGISMTAKNKMLEIIERVGGLKVIRFVESGWDTHQDVYAVQKLPE